MACIGLATAIRAGELDVTSVAPRCARRVPPLALDERFQTVPGGRCNTAGCISNFIAPPDLSYSLGARWPGRILPSKRGGTHACLSRGLPGTARYLQSQVPEFCVCNGRAQGTRCSRTRASG